MLRKAVTLGSLQPILCFYKETTAVFLKSFGISWPIFDNGMQILLKISAGVTRSLSDEGELLQQKT